MNKKQSKVLITILTILDVCIYSALFIIGCIKHDAFFFLAEIAWYYTGKSAVVDAENQRKEIKQAVKNELIKELTAIYGGCINDPNTADSCKECWSKTLNELIKYIKK